jgi:hypothetical protein
MKTWRFSLTLTAMILAALILTALLPWPALAQDGGIDSSDRLAGTWYVLGIEIFNGNRSQTYNGVLTFNSQGGLSSGTLTYPAARNPELEVTSADLSVAGDGSLSGTLTREDEQILTVTFGRISESGDKIILAGERTDTGGTIWDANETWIK